MSGEMVKFEFGGDPIRVHIDSDGVTWWVAADICAALDIRNPRDAVASLDDDEKGVGTTDTLGGPQKVATVNEPGVYNLIFRSRKPEAKAFKRWVLHEVLPSLRKTGSYAMPGSDSAQLRARGLLDGMELAEMMEARGLSVSQFKRFVCLCGKGLSSPEIGKIMGRTGRTIQRWRNDFSGRGLRLLPQDAPDPKCGREFAWAMLAAAGVELPARRAA